MKVTVGPTNNLVFQPSTDRGSSAKITVGTGGGGSTSESYGQANAAYSKANSAYNAANTAQTTAQNAYGQANAAYGQANTATTNADNAYNLANNNSNTINTVYSLANTNSTVANAAYGQANAAYTTANNRVLRAGDTMTGNLNVSAWLITQNVIPTTNNFYSLGGPNNRFKDLYVGGNTVYIGDAVLSSQGSEVRTDVFNAATSFVSGGLNVLNQANSAYDAANTAYGAANNRVLKAGDTMTGTLTIDVVGVGLNVNSQSQFSNTVTISNASTGNGFLEVVGSANVRDTVTTNTINFGSNIYDFTSNTFQTTANYVIEVDSFSAALYSTVKYVVQVRNGLNLHSTELFCIQDGVSTYMTEYATLISGAPLGTFSIVLSGGRMILNFNPDNPLNNILSVKVVRNTISS